MLPEFSPPINANTLSECLMNMFTVREWIRETDRFHRICTVNTQVSETLPPADFFFEVAKAFQRRGFIDRQFVDDLLELRPHREMLLMSVFAPVIEQESNIRPESKTEETIQLRGPLREITEEQLIAALRELQERANDNCLLILQAYAGSTIIRLGSSGYGANSVVRLFLSHTLQSIAQIPIDAILGPDGSTWFQSLWTAGTRAGAYGAYGFADDLYRRLSAPDWNSGNHEYKMALQLSLGINTISPSICQAYGVSDTLLGPREISKRTQIGVNRLCDQGIILTKRQAYPVFGGGLSSNQFNRGHTRSNYEHTFGRKVPKLDRFTFAFTLAEWAKFVTGHHLAPFPRALLEPVSA